MELFLDPRVEFEKVAAEVRLPESPDQWATEILQELYKQVPYISDFDPKIIMDRVDAEQGFGFGHVEVKNKTEAPDSASAESMEAAGIQEVRIPIVIKSGKLSPLDILVTADSKMLPLTETRLRQAIFRPQMFDITSKTPGDQSMIGQLYPPQRSNFGYGGAGSSMGAEGMGKSGSAKTAAENAMARVNQHGSPEEKARVYAAVAKKFPELAHKSSVPEVRAKVKTASILQQILPTINEEDYTKFASHFSDETLRAAYLANDAATRPALSKLAGYTGWSAHKVASRTMQALRPTVMQVTKVAEGYCVKDASHRLWMPKEEIINRGQLVKMAGVKLALDVDLNKSVTVADGASVDRDLPDDERVEQVSDFGMWKVQTTDGQELVGFVFPTLLDLDGQPVPVALFTNGTQTALQADMAGVRVGEGASLFEGPPSGHGLFYKVIGTGKAVGTVPITIHGELGGEEGASFMAETFDGHPVKIVQQPGVEIPSMAGEDTSVIPMDWTWLPLENTESVSLVEHVDGASKQAAAREEACSVTVRSGGPNSFSIGGMILEKLGHAQTEFLSYDDAVFLLAGLGVAPAYAQQKLANAVYWRDPVQCRIGRQIETVQDNVGIVAAKTAEVFKDYVNLRQDLIKEAAFIPDPMSVDTILSLGFINPENINEFISSLPILDESQQKLCELLLAARLGCPDLSANALERAIKATETTIDGLKVIAFNKN